MRVPLSWLKDYVDITIPAELLGEKLTAAGLEVAKIEYIGLPQAVVPGLRYPKSDHLVWDDTRILLGKITEVKAHPNAERLVLAMVEIADGVIEQCVTGAPNLFGYKDAGPLNPPVWTAFAAEGAEVWDGHSEERKRMILKEKPLRGIPNRSMVCSEKELGISDEHEGIILMREQPLNQATRQPAAPGTPFSQVMGDIVFEIEFTPNLARAISVYGVAREIAALLDVPLRPPSWDVVMEGAAFGDAASVTITEPELNPRFTLALLRGTKVQPAPEWMQARLRLVGQRPINNIVDVTNYITFEMGQPLHAFDYDKLAARAEPGRMPHLITRLAQPGERLLTLDGQDRALDPHNILVCDERGALGVGGVIGGQESEIDDGTTTVLLEAAAWNFINIRRTMTSQKLRTEASYRFSRGVHPSQAILGLRRGIELMRQTGGGQVAQGVYDNYPNPPKPAAVDLTEAEIFRILGVRLTAAEAAAMLRRADFTVEVQGTTLLVTAPDWRMDIGEGTVGRADVIEELARLYGYDRIPTTIIVDEMPPQFPNQAFLREEAVRDALVSLGLHEVISYRFTTPEREALLTPPGSPSALPAGGYVTMANPISPDKTVLRKSILTGLLEAARGNARYADRQVLFELGSVYVERDGQLLPDEPKRLGIVALGRRALPAWDHAPADTMDFYDLKGLLDALLGALHVSGVQIARAEHASFHPGRSAQMTANGAIVGTYGELHPRVAAAFGLEGTVLAADIDLAALTGLMDELYPAASLPTMPGIVHDIALVVKESVTNAEVETVIRKAGGQLLKSVRLFDVYRGANLPEGHKNMAYSVVYQTDDRTLTEAEAIKIREKITKLAERELGGALRS
jgi:phenylalanyl-tRNA synthetase beta chain